MATTGDSHSVHVEKNLAAAHQKEVEDVEGLIEVPCTRSRNILHLLSRLDKFEDFILLELPHDTCGTL